VLTGLYVFDLDALQLGVGGGYQFMVNPDSSAWFLEAVASFAPSDSLSIYAGLDYWFDYEDVNFKAGASFAF